ncbi:branched-chain amino acid ABC transporter permease [Reyranella sp. CPCC 100927]|uniref:branched-chain amino acid ABC transporter permease n=1 Tax=Reyranella sp. CPCC 100927 TaxID=2599616 RepID=UPI0015B45BD3|nr:branched-chain amino acid ABC transporter permease [Reyranella sp. CPCC 100927]
MNVAAVPASSRTGMLRAGLVMLSILAGFALLALFLRKAEGMVLAAIVAGIFTIVALPASRNAAWRGLAILQAHPRAAVAACAIGAVLLPIFLHNDGYWIHVLSIAMIFAIMAIGLNVHLGEIGLVNLGYAGLFAVGAYASTLLSQAGAPFWLATLFAMTVCWTTGGLLGFFSVRTSGDYFALVTLGFGLIVQQLIINLTWLTQGNNGITNIPAVSMLGHTSKMPIDLGIVRLVPETNFFYLCLVALCGSLVLARHYQKVWIGRMWTALRQDAIGVSCFGLDVPRFKILTVAFGSMFAGLAGSLFAHEIGFISPDDFTLLHSVEVLASVILGGIGNLFGVTVGAIILSVAPEKLRFLGDYRLLMYGAMLVVLLIYRPLGLLPDPRRRFESF